MKKSDQPTPGQRDVLDWGDRYGERLPLAAMSPKQRRSADRCEARGWLTWTARTDLLPIPGDALLSIMHYVLTDQGRAAMGAEREAGA